MSSSWHYVLHQRAFETMDQMPTRERRVIRESLYRLIAAPFSAADSDIRPVNDRPYQVRNVGQWQVVYWLDVFVREVCVVAINRRNP